MGVRGETSIEGQGKVGWNIPGGLEVLGGGYFVTREKGQGQWRGGGRMDIFGTKGKSQLGRPTTANAFSR